MHHYLHSLVLLIALTPLLACTAPPKSGDPTNADLSRQLDAMERELVALREEVAALRAGEDPQEFRQLTIDRAVWGDDPAMPEHVRENLGRSRLLCRIVEWRGFPPMKQFTATADKVFYLEAPGLPPVEGYMGTGGSTSSDGRWRHVLLHFSESQRARIEPEVAYSLRPRNDVEGYRWRIADGVSVARP